ncbi:MAG: SpoVR family protein [Candidatus Latescibacteria bacterium]|nr:SpoVR family protein [Candidatus Latescibacterota bacterium]
MIATYRKFPTELKLLKYEIAEHAKSFGLDFFDVIFEVVEYGEMNEIAAYGGFPTRYPHWRFGMEYEYLSKTYSYGLSRIYEMVINNDPCYAYLLRCNNVVDQKLVISHVFGHSDFFKNNLWFAQTNRKMIDEIANHATRIARSIERYGEEIVEGFIDTCLSIEDLIDVHALFIKRRQERSKYDFEEEGEEPTVKKLKSDREYMDAYINPPVFLEQEKRKLNEDKKKEQRFPSEPERDMLFFLIENAPLEHWQRDILSIIREESYYFAPQAQTKVINEGWSAYWHSKIMTEKVLKDSELIDYADHHSGTLGTHPGRINPYKLGIELFRDIEDRWNRGRFGKEYEEYADLEEKRRWDKQLGLGREKIFEVRQIYNDVGFIDEFLTEEFCREHRLFTYAHDESTGAYEIESRDFKKIKEKLLFSLTNFGKPFIEVEDGNYRNRGELYLRHKHGGIDLRIDHAKETLKNIQRLWTRPVHVETKINDREVLLTYDGTEHIAREIGGARKDGERAKYRSLR